MLPSELSPAVFPFAGCPCPAPSFPFSSLSQGHSLDTDFPAVYPQLTNKSHLLDMHASEALCIFCLPPSVVPILFQFLIPLHYSSSVFLICSPNTFTTDVPLHASHTILFPSQTLGHHSCIQHRSSKLRGKIFLHNSSAALEITVCSFSKR